MAGPTAKGERPRDDRQAVLAEPPRLVQLEKALAAQCQVGDPRWMALLGQLIQASACMRFVHRTRSDVLALYHEVDRACLLESYFAIPSAFTSKWDWTDPWVKGLEPLPASRHSKCVACALTGRASRGFFGSQPRLPRWRLPRRLISRRS